jgi:hypothetical protein
MSVGIHRLMRGPNRQEYLRFDAEVSPMFDRLSVHLPVISSTKWSEFRICLTVRIKM